jgi:excinuclease ABC subunit A
MDLVLRRLIAVGVGYLTLDRATPSLSAGEAQRLRLAALLGSGLTGVLYVLDEPTIGLHPRDTARLIKVMRQLRDLGNTVLVVEHDLEVIRQADYVVDVGPGAGKLGGRIMGAGTPAEICATIARAHSRGTSQRQRPSVDHSRRARTQSKKHHGESAAGHVDCRGRPIGFRQIVVDV